VRERIRDPGHARNDDASEDVSGAKVGEQASIGGRVRRAHVEHGAVRELDVDDDVVVHRAAMHLGNRSRDDATVAHRVDGVTHCKRRDGAVAVGSRDGRIR